FEFGGRRRLLRLRSLGESNDEERHRQRRYAHDVEAKGHPQTEHGWLLQFRKAPQDTTARGYHRARSLPICVQLGGNRGPKRITGDGAPTRGKVRARAAPPARRSCL